MDIVMDGNKFGVGIFRHGFDCEGNDDGSLNVWATEKDGWAVQVITNPGDFFEVVKDGDVIASGGDGDWGMVRIGKEPVTIRAKKFPPLRMSKEDLNEARKVVTRTLCYDSPYSLGVPDKMADVIKWMQDKLEEIPADCRGSARFDFDTHMEYGETYEHIEITYKQPETDKEVRRRLQIERERSRRKENEELAKLAALKDKYEPTPGAQER